MCADCWAHLLPTRAIGVGGNEGSACANGGRGQQVEGATGKAAVCSANELSLPLYDNFLRVDKVVCMECSLQAV